MTAYSRVELAFLAMLASVIMLTGDARAAGWSLAKSSAGTPVARLVTGDAIVPAIELACAREGVAIGVQAAAPATLRLLPIVFTSGTERPIALSLPRIGGAASFAGILPDARLLDGLTGAWQSFRIAAGGRPLNPPIAGASPVVRQALANCYSQSTGMAAASPKGRTETGAPAGRSLFLDSSLPSSLRRDLADFENSCTFAPDEYGEFKLRAKRGPALAVGGALQRADFNGDGVDDYLLDTTKLRCTRSLPDDGSDSRLMIYTSQPGGAFVHSLDASFGRYRVVPGRKAALFLHTDAVTDEAEGDSPAINETLSMTGPTTWQKGQLGEPDWRFGQLSGYPRSLQDQFAKWDQDCAAAGRRLRFLPGYGGELITGKSTSEAGTSVPLDLNRDGKRDYVVDTADLSCGVFSPAVRPKPYCGSDCELIAVISRPDGTHMIDRVAGSITFNGNGDPASIVTRGRNSAITWPAASGSKCVMIEVSWTGTTQQRRNVPCPG